MFHRFVSHAIKTTTDATTAVKDSTAKTATTVKSTTNNATSAVSSSFFGVVGMAKKVNNHDSSLIE